MTPIFAVVGTYRSGSSFWAGVLHHLGVNMGSPFWELDDPHHPDNHYEPLHESVELRSMWHEPLGISYWTSAERVAFLRRYVAVQGVGVTGIKHPLLSLMIPDMRKAWGSRLFLIHAARPLAESIASIHRTQFPWTSQQMYHIQTRLANALRGETFDLSLPLFSMTPGERRGVVYHIAGMIQGVTAKQLQQACDLFRV